MDANQRREEENIQTFISVTGASREVARQFLESSVWDLNAATSSYYSSDLARSNYNQPTPPLPPSAVPKPTTTPSVSNAGPRIATLSSFTEDKGDGQNNLYAGGKQSGIQLQGRPEDQNRSMVDKLFQKKSEPIPEPAAKPKSFGTGYKLGTTPQAPVVPVKEEVEEVAQNPNITITFWRQGFVVDDGPLRRYEEPSNANFLKDIDDGVVPRELHSRMNRGATAANVTLVDKKQSDYEEPVVQKPKVVPFSGNAQKLGDSSSMPAVQNSPSATSASGGAGGNARIQIRLADGTVLRAQFTMDQTIDDIRKFIDSAKPQQKNYQLLILILVLCWPIRIRQYAKQISTMLLSPKNTFNQQNK